MSHDLRTPMNGILGLAKLMRDETEDEALLKDISQLEMSGQYLLQLINDILDVSKIEAGKLELRLKPIDSEALFGNILANASMLAKNKGVDFKVEAPNIPHGKWVPVMADASRLEQVMMNILSNAVKFTNENGTVAVKMETISVTTETVTDKYTISDTGIGISEEFLPHIFEPFSQEGRSNTNRENGTGLGMPIVKQLVTMMNGEISIDSKLGEGTTVTLIIRYPVARKGSEEKTKKVADYSSLAGKRILLCEDHPLNAEIAARLLEKEKVIVEYAEDGKKGVDMFTASASEYYDAILMDIRMPIMNGLEAAKAIRQLNRSDAKTVPIIAMTANAYDDDIKESKDAGMNAHLSKPINPEILYDALARAVEENAKNK